LSECYSLNIRDRKEIAGIADGLDWVTPCRCRVELSAEPANVHVEVAVQRMEWSLKNADDKILARKHNTGRLDEQLKQGELDVGQVQMMLSVLRTSRCKIDN
jgi:hypothetical protein